MSQVKVITVAARKIDDKWEAALISQGRFIRALVGEDLYKLVTPLLIPYLQNSQPNDTEIGIVINVTPPVVTKNVKKNEEEKEEDKEEDNND